MKVAVVTSCSLVGWEQYGQRCIDTLCQYWPHDVEIHFASEHPADDFIPKLQQARGRGSREITYWDLMTAPTVADFYARHINNLQAHGKLKGHASYSFRHDAFKFSKKVFAIAMVAERTDADRLIWLDADTVSHVNVPMELLTRFPREPHDVAALTRGHYHSECGFVVYNLNSKHAQDLIKSFAHLYYSDKVFNLKEWNDCFVFDYLCKHMKISVDSIPHTSKSHPFVYSELGKYMDHLKGKRKVLGASPERRGIK